MIQLGVISFRAERRPFCTIRLGRIADQISEYILEIGPAFSPGLTARSEQASIKPRGFRTSRTSPSCFVSYRKYRADVGRSKMRVSREYLVLPVRIELTTSPLPRGHVGARIYLAPQVFA